MTELLDGIRAGGDIDVIRKGVELVLQALIDTKATERIGAGCYERTDARTTQRNGHRERLLTTKAGDVEQRIPKLRRGSFFPSILERRRRIDRALFAVVMEAYTHEVSTRKVDDLVAALGAASGISKSEVSRICAGLDEEMAAFRIRGLGHVEFPYVFADATYLKGRVGGQVVSRAVVVVTGVTMSGEREVLGCAVGDTENGPFWTEFFRSLRSPGLSGGRLVISDHHLGLKAAIAKVFIGASWQRSSVNMTSAGSSRWSPPPPGEDLGSVTGKVPRQTRPSRRWRTLIGQWESCLEQLDERPRGSAMRVACAERTNDQWSQRATSGRHSSASTGVGPTICAWWIRMGAGGAVCG